MSRESDGAAIGPVEGISLCGTYSLAGLVTGSIEFCKLGPGRSHSLCPASSTPQRLLHPGDSIDSARILGVVSGGQLESVSRASSER